MNTKNHELIAAELIAGKEGGSRLLALLGHLEGEQYAIQHQGSAATLWVINQGRTASILTSIPTTDQAIADLQALLAKTLSTLREKPLALAQIVLPKPAPSKQVQAILSSGFKDLAELQYMELNISPLIPTNVTQHEVEFQTMESFDDHALGYVLEQTYIDSLDCPNLHGIRQVQDVIEGHRGSDPCRPELWFIGMIDDEPSCVLLLNQKDDAVELAYVGVVPSHRNRGIADCCMSKSIELAQHHDFKRITLVVDDANSSAMNLYTKWDFHPTQSRRAFMAQLC